MTWPNGLARDFMYTNTPPEHAGLRNAFYTANPRVTSYPTAAAHTTKCIRLSGACFFMKISSTASACQLVHGHASLTDCIPHSTCEWKPAGLSSGLIRPM